MGNLNLREFIWNMIEVDPMLEWHFDLMEVPIAGLPAGADFINKASKLATKSAHISKAIPKALPSGLEKARELRKINLFKIQQKLKGLM